MSAFGASPALGAIAARSRRDLVAARRASRFTLAFALGIAVASIVSPTIATASPPARPRAKQANAAAIVDRGRLAGADFRIDVPAHWNRKLIVFFHGYAIDPVRFDQTAAASPMFAPMLDRGYAVAQSAYSQTGWAIEQGSADSERLRRYFVAHHGEPQKTYAMGMSMGGALTVLALESRADVYAGGLSLCGAIDASDRLLQRDFAMLAAFDYYFPNVLGALVPVDPDYRPTAAVVRRIADAFAANPAAFASLRALYGAADQKSLADVIAFDAYKTMEMQRRTHANPFGNADLVYTGSGDDAALNAGVKRYRADRGASVAMGRWYAPSGELKRPLLALHDLGDPLVLASSAFDYVLLAGRNGHGDNVVQQYVDASGHCVFTPAEVDRAFDALVDWTATGKRPVSGRQP